MRLTGFAQRFNEDGFGQIFTQGDAGVADLTDQTRMAADEADALFLAQAHFAEAIHHVWLHGQMLDANRRARLNGRKRAGLHIGAASVGNFLGRQMGAAFMQSNRFSQIDALIALPLFPSKERKRGYNQAAVLCEGFSSTTGIPFLNNVVVRTTPEVHERVARFLIDLGAYVPLKPK